MKTHNPDGSKIVPVPVTRITKTPSGYRIERGTFRAVIFYPEAGKAYQVLVNDLATDEDSYSGFYPTLMAAADAVQDRVNGAGIYGYISTRFENA